MKELESLLDKREMFIMVDFNHLNNCIQCYAYIINICLSHVISSMMSVSKQYLSKLKVPVDPSPMTHNDSEDELDSDDINTDNDIDELELVDWYDDCDNANIKEWHAGIKRDPLRHARRVICLLHSLDQCWEGFCRFIQDGNERNWFSKKSQSGKHRLVQVPEL